MKRLLVILASAAALIIPGVASAAPHPSECPSGSVLMGAQDWYPDDIVHMHLDVCAPIYQTVSGTITMKAWRTKHNLPGTSDIVYRRFRDALGTSDSPALGHTNFWCANPGTCVQAFNLPFVTTYVRRDGWAEFVPQQKNKDGACGNDRLAIMDIPLNVQNGKAEQSRNPVTPGAAGFCDAFYATVEHLTPIPVTSPANPQVMPFTMRVKFSDAPCGSKANCHLSGPVTGYSVHADPAFHGGHEGTTLAQGTGTNPTVDVTVNPADFAPGWHNLVFRARQPIVSRGTVNSGLGNFWVYVDGGAA